MHVQRVCLRLLRFEHEFSCGCVKVTLKRVNGLFKCICGSTTNSDRSLWRATFLTPVLCRNRAELPTCSAVVGIVVDRDEDAALHAVTLINLLYRAVYSLLVCKQCNCVLGRGFEL